MGRATILQSKPIWPFRDSNRHETKDGVHTRTSISSVSCQNCLQWYCWGEEGEPYARCVANVDHALPKPVVRKGCHIQQQKTSYSKSTWYGKLAFARQSQQKYQLEFTYLTYPESIFSSARYLLFLNTALPRNLVNRSQSEGASEEGASSVGCCNRSWRNHANNTSAEKAREVTTNCLPTCLL